MVLSSWGSYWHLVDKQLSPSENISERKKKGGGEERGRSRFPEGENSLNTKKRSGVNFFLAQDGVRMWGGGGGGGRADTPPCPMHSNAWGCGFRIPE